MSSNLTPLQVCEALIGKPGQISLACGLQEKAAFAWRHGSNNRAAGHLPSTLIQQRLLAHSAANRLGLTAEHLIWGASEAEIEAILAERHLLATGHPSLAPAREGETTPEFTSRRANPQGVAA